jgi:hypothetical protein
MFKSHISDVVWNVELQPVFLVRCRNVYVVDGDCTLVYMPDGRVLTGYNSIWWAFSSMQTCMMSRVLTESVSPWQLHLSGTNWLAVCIRDCLMSEVTSDGSIKNH